MSLFNPGSESFLVSKVDGRAFTPAAAGDFTISSANTAVRLTLAAVTNARYIVDEVLVSFSANPTAGVLCTLYDGATAKRVFYVTNGGAAPVPFSGFLGTASTAVGLEIGAGGAGIIGIANFTQYRTEKV